MKALHTLALTAAAMIVIFGAYGLVDKIDRDADARADYKRWTQEACLPILPGESALIVSDGRQMRCRIYRNATPGMAPVIVSAAVMEVLR
jgi:hypothetical protein